MKVTSHEVVDKELVVNKQIIAYFDHEFITPTLKKVDADFTEIVDNGFTHVVLTVSEGDIETRARRSAVRALINEIQDRNLEVWADPWHVGGVFGGEAQSSFEESGEASCFCNPKLDNLMRKWIGTTVELGADAIFWDEPEMKCDDHRNKGYELPFLEKHIAAAGRLALSSVVVLPADERRMHQFVDIAVLPDVAEIGSDPYFLNAFDKTITEAERLDYQWRWNKYVKCVADMAGKRSHTWVRNFGVSEGREAMIDEHIAIAREAIGSVAVWGFHGCASVPNFHKEGTLSPMQHCSTTLRFLRKLREKRGDVVA